MNLKIGDKVKLPIGKASDRGIKWENSALRDTLSSGQDYLYIRDKTGIMAAISPSMTYNSNDDYALYRLDDLELYEEPLPEKWAIYIKNDRDGKEVYDWLNKNKQTLSDYTLNLIGEYYIHYPACIGHLHRTLIQGYKEIDIHTFRKITNTQMNDKKIIGYKLLKDVADAKAGTTGIIEGNKVVFSSLDDLKDEEDYTAESFYSLKFCENSKDWFEPVYEEEVEEETIYVGSPIKKVTVNSKGVIDVWTGDITAIRYKIQDILSLKNLLKPLVGYWNGLAIEIDRLKVGCDKGTYVSNTDIQNVIDLYNKLNPKK
jgi:hypothetical protein